MHRTMLSAAVLLSILAGVASAQELLPDETVGAKRASGTVFWDDNANGVMDPGERGAGGVRLKAGWTMVATGEDGRYTVASDEPFIVVSLSFPSGTRPTGPWYRRIVKDSETGVDFGLERVQQKLPFLVAQFTDVHRSWGALRMVYDECMALPQPPAFFIGTGDMRSGSPWIGNLEDLRSSFGEMVRNTQGFEVPLFMTPGNHDTVGYGGRELTAEHARHPLFENRCWERYVGPSSWSFTWGGVHFMGVPCYTWEGGALTRTGPAVGEWIRGEVAAIPEGTRTVLAGHANGAMEWVPQIGLTAGVMGDTHTTGRYFQPGNEEPALPENVYVTGVCQGPRDKYGRRYNQDGSPSGYRLLAISDNAITTFYKPLGEDHAILVNEPRRFVTIEARDKLVVHGQVWDPKGEVSGVRVALGEAAADATLTRGFAWQDFTAEIPLDGLAGGFHTLDVRATWPDGAWHVAEPYLVLTGRHAPLRADAPAVLRGVAGKLDQEAQLVFNGEQVAAVGPIEDGEEVAVTVPAKALRALNEVRLAGDWDATLDNVKVEFGGRTYIDQHRVFTWGFHPRLSGSTRAKPLYFDLTSPDNWVQWEMKPLEK